MMTKLTTAVALAALVTASACGREAGSSVDEGGFGNPTMNNIDVQVNGYVLDLNARFSEEVPTTVNFAFDRTELDEQARAILRQQADWIGQFPEARFSVFGHTDLVGSVEYNRQLGLRRANAVVSYLESLGISRSRLEAKVSFGKTQPLVVTNNRERRPFSMASTPRLSGANTSSPRRKYRRMSVQVSRRLTPASNQNTSPLFPRASTLTGVGALTVSNFRTITVF